MARNNRDPRGRYSNEGSAGEKERRSSRRGFYESGEYGDYDDGGYDDDEEDDYAFESDYDDDDYADYDTSFDEDDASWGRKQEQFDGIKGESRRNRRNDQRSDFSEGYESDFDEEGDFGDESNSRGRGFASMPRERVRRIASKGGHALHGGGRGSSRRSTSGGRSLSARSNGSSSREGTGGSSRRSNTNGSSRRSASSSGLRTRSGAGSRKGFAEKSRTQRKRVASAGGRASRRHR